jgi:hypothetical protein
MNVYNLLDQLEDHCRESGYPLNVGEAVYSRKMNRVRITLDFDSEKLHKIPG